MTTPSPDPETTLAVQRALATEHAAIWALGLVTAFLPAALSGAVAEAFTAHVARREATARLLRDRGATPVAAEPAYATPSVVTDQPTALALLVAAESDCAAAWRSVLEHTDDAPVREHALAALIEAAVRATRWRRTAGLSPATAPFPGVP